VTIFLWKGYHSPEIHNIIASAWNDGNLAIFLPPTQDDFSFVTRLPAGELVARGEWAPHELEILASLPRQNPVFPTPPVLGLFSSGTSGAQPKLVLYSKANIEFSLDGVMNFFETWCIDHIFCYPHPFHTFGLLLGYVLAFRRGWDFTALDGKYNSQFHQQWLQESGRRSLTLGTPTHFKDLLQFVRSHQAVPTPTYSCIIGGAAVHPDLWDEIHEDLKIEKPSIGYGATEASPALTHLPPGRKPNSPGDIGWPISGVEIELQPGDGFVFRGPNVCLALIQNGVVSFPREIFIKDQLEVDDHGAFRFQGRTDFVLNRGGEKFLLEDIENHLQNTLGLHCIALAVPDARLGFDLGLLTESATLTFDAIIRCLEDKYQVHFSEKHFRAVPTLPLNDSRKKDRKKALSDWNSSPQIISAVNEQASSAP